MPASPQPNRPPSLVTATFAPGPYNRQSTLSVHIAGAADPDGDVVHFRYQWIANGRLVTGLISSTAEARLFHGGDVIACRVTPEDGHDDGAPRMTPTIMIVNHAPQLESVGLTPDLLTAGGWIEALPVGWSDVDGDAPQYQFSWLVNGMEVPAASEPILEYPFLVKGDAVEVLATPFDGDLQGVPRRSGFQIVQNSPPVFSRAVIGGGPFLSDQSLRVSPLGWWDADGDSEQYRYAWLRNGRWVPAQKSATLSGAFFQAGDTVAALVTPWDGQAEGLPRLSNAVRIGFEAEVAINEVAWMGTSASLNDEWIELFNAGRAPVNLAGWTLAAKDGSPFVSLTGILAPRGYFLLERSDDATVPEEQADLIYQGSLGNTGEWIELRDASGKVVDTVGGNGAWFAGSLVTKTTMERHTPLVDGQTAANWYSSTGSYSGGRGTPKRENSNSGFPKGGVTEDWYKLYLAHNRTATMPSSTPREMTLGLIAAIDQTTVSIDFALYGIDSANMVLDALARAAARGVRIRGVVDSDAVPRFTYGDTKLLYAMLPTGSVVADEDDRLMHNKFLIFDGSRVWTGSTNLSRVELITEYAADISILIDDAGLAAAYTEEFDEMFAGRFHGRKHARAVHVMPRYSDGSYVEVYFGPKNDAARNAIIRTIDSAKVSLAASIFYFTDPDIAGAFMAARARGVDVRMIADAEGATDPYAQIGALRETDVRVKIENWGGFLHEKVLVADGFRVVLGSQNWTSAGNGDNDENTLYIENARLGQALMNDFEAAWQSIPEEWSTGFPRPESGDSPGSLTDLVDNDHDGLADEGAPERLAAVSEAPGAINVYFDKGVWSPTTQPVVNQHVNLEQRLIHRIQSATTSVDIAVYELHLARVADALLQKARSGVPVRMIVDGKEPDVYPVEEVQRYELMRILLEKLRRGADGILGTADDVAVLADSPVFAVTGADLRAAWGLPAEPADIPNVSVLIAGNPREGRLLVDAERKAGGAGYYAADDQMHNKFMIVDRKWSWTGSWNFSVSGLYGDSVLESEGILGGNTDQVVEIHSPALADIYETEFQEMWGGSTNAPNPDVARFHARKTDNTAHSVQVGERQIDVYFSPGDGALDHVRQAIQEQADVRVYFEIYAWSDQALLDILKTKWEGSPLDLTGTRTGFDVRGIFDSEFWDDWWSASIDMTGRTAAGSASNPNTRWAVPPPVFAAQEDRLLHSKCMIVDAGTGSDPFVIVGSTNWSANGADVNDENLLIIHDATVADAFALDFWARYYRAGGDLPDFPLP